jgi:hypothetical protein
MTYTFISMFLTLDQYLSFFPNVPISKEDFAKTFIITYASNPSLNDLFDLKSVIKGTNDERYRHRDEILDYFYDVVVTHRHQYLSEFYKSYFEVPKVYDLKWDGVDICTRVDVNFDSTEFSTAWLKYLDDPEDPEGRNGLLEQFNQLIDQPLSGLSLQKNDLSRKVIRNLNYLDILHNTQITNTCKSKTSFWQTLINVYNQLRLEDRFFAPSSIGLFLREKNKHEVNFNNFFYLIQQYQPKASILNPYTINWVLKNVFTGTKLFTPVLSWASYLCAFMHSDWEHYVGVDVMQGVCDRCQFLFDHYQTVLKPQVSDKEVQRLSKKRLDLYCRPSESLLYDGQFLNKYSDYFDAVLICPPYYNMEIYPEGQQSIDLYPDYQMWLNRYWEDTVATSHMVLKKGKHFGLIVNNYVSLKKDDYPLIQDLNMIALKYFKLVGVYNLLNRVSPLRVNKKNRTEMLFIYQKTT